MKQHFKIPVGIAVVTNTSLSLFLLIFLLAQWLENTLWSALSVWWLLHQLSFSRGTPSSGSSLLMSSEVSSLPYINNRLWRTSLVGFWGTLGFLGGPPRFREILDNSSSGMISTLGARDPSSIPALGIFSNWCSETIDIAGSLRQHH